ncbi:baseplate J/gp47 family protein [Rhodanobacter sp. AS-Z3]|uniref:baseplate J/gp47 family protein n=1 Tax=Rhodanobacter sp. AS-Z3 TaxID=3031330 RepID=UPI0024788E27|nr:baseplate J/gp47 family protein [Rhodanobacter sp. AS-Z3]WEN13756.1 baseplate J/gp47 family protein [Rhodanobacter sp. AS-Z3]
MTNDCSHNDDPLKLVREGTSQDERAPATLSPDAAPVDARTVAHDIVFAQGYAGLLRRYSAANVPDGDWRNYFGGDMAVPLAVAAIEDVDAYKVQVREWFDFLNNMDNDGDAAGLRDRLGYLYAAIGTLADALDQMHRKLAEEAPLKGTLDNMIRTQLAPAFARLVAYYKGGMALGVINVVAPPLRVLQYDAKAFADVLSEGLSNAWSGDTAWAGYVSGIAADDSVYGAAGLPDPFMRINHCATHNLFRSVFDLFLKALMRTVSESQAGLADTLANVSDHAPHYALYLAFLQLLAHARAATNGLTRRHLDFYYSTILGLQPRPAQPGHVHLLAELAKQASQCDFAPGTQFKAGKDASGKPVIFASVDDLVANKATVVSLKTVYRHGSETLSNGEADQGRLFASPVANSDDGLGAALTSPDKSWQPFFNKEYVDGELVAIDMPPAQVGFAIASHHLLLAEGTRHVIVQVHLRDALPAGFDLADDVQCQLSTAKGWLVRGPSSFARSDSNTLELMIELSGADDAIVPYTTAKHGYNFDTDLPLLLVTLKQDTQRNYAYARVQGLVLMSIDLRMEVSGIKTVAAANDFGPIDLSKPFQPFGASPVENSGLVVGSKEAFQKHLDSLSLDLTWQIAPVASASTPPPSNMATGVVVDVLQAGSWTNAITSDSSLGFGSSSAYVTLEDSANATVSDLPDFQPDQPYTTSARQGYLRVRLNGDVGQRQYQSNLIAYLRKDSGATEPDPRPPQGPVASALALSYVSSTSLVLSSSTEASFQARVGRFFHLLPFGSAERHPYLCNGAPVPLLAPFSFARNAMALSSEAELYIGVADLAPPQSLALLFQVADGTANPLANKPVPHIDWSYLVDNLWVPFPQNAVVDATGGLLNSGIVTFSVPRDAASDNRLLPPGLYWIRAAVHEASDAVCRLKLVAAQALQAIFTDKGNAADFSATPVPSGSVAQLAASNASVKDITQPYPSFGGRGAESGADFHRRVSERLRHKDRAIDLWDYERLVLEAFPSIYKVKCLNHTQYEPADSVGTGLCSGGIYRELAPGHVTLIALPNLRGQVQRDPLKPYTSLGLLGEIQASLAQRCSGFVQLHVRNPQFEEVRVAFTLKLRDGYDEAYYTTRLQQAITRFLSPWAFDGSGTPSFGGKVYKSTLIHFVETQACVDYVTDFSLFHNLPCQAPGSVDQDEITGSRAVSILVSAPASKHQITVIRPAPDGALAERCGCSA